MTSVPPLAQKALELARRREFDQALVAAKQALEQHRDDMGLQLFVGLLHARRMELPEALPYLRSAHALAPDDATCRLELVRVLIAVGQLSEAEALIAHDGLPGNDTDELRAMIRLRRGDTVEIARREDMLGRPERALEELERAVEVDPDNVAALTALAELYERLNWLDRL